MEVDQRIIIELNERIKNVSVEALSVELFTNLLGQLYTLVDYYNIDIDAYEKLRSIANTLETIKKALEGKQ